MKRYYYEGDSPHHAKPGGFSWENCWALFVVKSAANRLKAGGAYC
jgi:hypothetical protein